MGSDFKLTINVIFQWRILCDREFSIFFLNFSKYIFLHAGGGCPNTTHDYPGVYGYYWSVTLYSLYDAWFLLFNSSDIYWSYSGYNARNIGMSIRPLKF